MSTLRVGHGTPFLDSYFRLRPVNATFTGVHEHDDRLPDWSAAGLDAAVDEMSRLRRSAAGAAPDIDAELGDAFLEIQIAELEARHFQRGNPALYTGEAVFSVIALMTREFAPAPLRIESAIARMHAIPAFLAGARETIASAPHEWTRRAIRECEGARVLFDGGIAEWLRVCQADALMARRALSAAALAGRAFAEFRAWCERGIDASPPSAYGCGPDFYDLLLRRGHWCERGREELLREAHERVEMAAARLGEMAARTSEGGWPQVQERLAQLHPTTREYLGRYRDLWEECRRVAEAQRLVTWPDYPIRYVPIPTFTRVAAPSLYYLFYRSPAPYDALPVHDYVVPPIESSMPRETQEQLLRATNDSVIKLNHVVHHGALGHHVQNHYAYRAASRIGQIAAVDCASRIGMFCGGSMAEGWACYATDLMDDGGFLTDLERVAEQHTRLRLLARAVVDLELHQGTMSLAAAARFYATRVGMSDAAAHAEAVRNSMFPATAIMYWLGTQGIHDLRAARAAVEGPRFSLRAFHDELLSYGSLPVPLIAARMATASPRTTGVMEENTRATDFADERR